MEGGGERWRGLGRKFFGGEEERGERGEEENACVIGGEVEEIEGAGGEEDLGGFFESGEEGDEEGGEGWREGEEGEFAAREGEMEEACGDADEEEVAEFIGAGVEANVLVDGIEEAAIGEEDDDRDEEEPGDGEEGGEAGGRGRH